MLHSEVLRSKLNFMLHCHATCANGYQKWLSKCHTVTSANITTHYYLLDLVRKHLSGKKWNSNRKCAFRKFSKIPKIFNFSKYSRFFSSLVIFRISILVSNKVSRSRPAFVSFWFVEWTNFSVSPPNLKMIWNQLDFQSPTRLVVAPMQKFTEECKYFFEKIFFSEILSNKILGEIRSVAAVALNKEQMLPSRS